MKQTKNNEMDLLLRGWARGESARSVAPGGNPAKHLDADELNSYAAQALPAAARARYTSHLVDCETCRKIVSELTSASGANLSEHSVSQKASAGFLQKLWGLFSPGRLRYAAPALALLAFIAVGLVVIRQQAQPEFVASNQPTTAARDGAIETNQGGSMEESQRSPATDERFHDSPANAVEDKDNLAKSAGSAKPGDTDETSNTSKTTDSVSVAADSSASPGKAAGQLAQPTYAPEPAPASPPKPQTTIAESRTDVVASPKREADEHDELARRQEGERARTDDRQNSVGSGASAIQGEEKGRTRQAKPLSVAGAKAKAEAADTQTVSGRQFRRQGEVWIDTAFHSSTGTTVVTRGSEQFRALVADEPGIRAIAAQLHGEVVVVWKGRAYRIR
jgi:hypothetical protein